MESELVLLYHVLVFTKHYIGNRLLGLNRALLEFITPQLTEEERQKPVLTNPHNSLVYDKPGFLSDCTVRHLYIPIGSGWQYSMLQGALFASAHCNFNCGRLNHALERVTAPRAGYALSLTMGYDSYSKPRQSTLLPPSQYEAIELAVMDHGQLVTTPWKILPTVWPESARLDCGVYPFCPWSKVFEIMAELRKM